MQVSGGSRLQLGGWGLPAPRPVLLFKAGVFATDSGFTPGVNPESLLFLHRPSSCPWVGVGQAHLPYLASVSHQC